MTKDHEFKTSLGYIVRTCLKNNNKVREREAINKKFCRINQPAQEK
jgi:hypothetical protein